MLVTIEMSTYFNIKNRTEAEQFDKYLKEYYESNCHFPFHTYLKLIDWFDWCQNCDNGGKIFASIFDIKLNYIFLDLESIKCVHIWGTRDKNTNILNNVNDFKLSVDLLRHLSTYVLKYRALIDKLMGLIFLCYAPEDYDKFRRGESRKTIFKKIFANKKIPLKIDPENVFTFFRSI